nr:hypothetical protein [Tanacetum cinerariifolium]
MVFNAVGPSFNPLEFRDSVPQESNSKALNSEAKRFYDLFSKAEPMYKGCEKHSTLSAMSRLLNMKSDFNISLSYYDRIMHAVKEFIPDSTLCSNYYKSKKIVSQLGLGYQKIDFFPNGCMIYYNKENKDKDKWHICSHPRYKPIEQGSSKMQGIPYKYMHYLPLTPRLQRLYMSKDTVQHMTWHHEYQRDPGVLSHPSDGEVWKHFDRTHPSFAVEPRNCRLGLYADGFSPFGISTNNYSCCSVIVTPYNLSPWMCIKIPYMFLTIIIPGPHSLKRSIDMFLEPLIDELIGLWKDDVETYDAFNKQNFQLKATLMWTVNDFLAFGMLSGWSTHGKLSCPYCMEKSKAFTLQHGRKTSFFAYHRQFLPRDHSFRRNKDGFIKGQVERDEPPHRLSGKEFMRLRVYHNWTKRSVFWDLPYSHTKLIQHNLDVIYVEKNVFDNIFKIIMDDKDKIKDNRKARQDVKEYYKRQELELVSDVNGKVSKTRASFSLTKEQKQRFMLDYIESRPVREDGKNIVVTLCKLKKILPPGFFDHMEHLVVNFSYEVRVGSHVQYRWMYPFERYLYHLKKKVKNKARVESLICEAYIMEEISNFYSHYFEPHVLTNLTRVRRNDDGGNVNEREDVLSIFKHPARPSGNSKRRYLNDDEYTTAILYAVCRTKSSSAIVAPAQSIDSAYQEDGNTLPFIITKHDEVEHLADNESDMQEQEELSREPSISKLFLWCHQNKKTKVFVDATAKATLEGYNVVYGADDAFDAQSGIGAKTFPKWIDRVG